MKNLFIVLGLLMSSSLIVLNLSLVGLIFTNWLPLFDFVKTLFAVFTLSCLSFLFILVFIPHGKRN
jgi:hypothetical protein